MSIPRPAFFNTLLGEWERLTVLAKPDPIEEAAIEARKAVILITVPFVAAKGANGAFLARTAESSEASAAPTIDPNKKIHIFGNAEHNLEPVVKAFGSHETAFNALHAATETAVRAQNLTGVFETVVKVGGQQVMVRGAVVDGTVRIGTAFVR